MFFLYTTFCSYKKLIKNLGSDLELPLIDNYLKFVGVSFADIIITLFISYLISVGMKINFWYVFFILLVFGILLQIYLCRQDILRFIDKQINYINPNLKFSINDVHII